MINLERSVFPPSIDHPFLLKVANGAEKALEREGLQEQINNSVSILLKEQHSESHLFPAATKERSVEKDHYNDTWVRDHAMVTIALLDSALAEVGDPSLVNKGRRAAMDGVEGSLALFAQEPWKSAFEQKVKDEVDQNGIAYTTLTKDPPPIHLKTDGSSCGWPTQNQPDSWGTFLILIGGLQENGYALSPQQEATIEKIVDYIVGLDITKFKLTAMWEWGEAYFPPPISTVSIVAHGLSKMKNLPERLIGPVQKTIKSCREAVKNHYPIEYTTPDHKGQADLATLVAMGLGAINLPSSSFLDLARRELGNGEDPGKIRYIGDHYYTEGKKEAIWPMGSLLESIVLYREVVGLIRDNLSEETIFNLKEKADNELCKIVKLRELLGYIPELLQQKNGSLFPNENELLWNEALMAQACCLSIVTSDALR